MSNQFENTKSNFEGKRQTNWYDEREVQNSQESGGRRRDTKEIDSHKKGRDEESFEDVSLPRTAATSMRVPPNGEFSNFPELSQATIGRMQAMNCKNLFPIQ